MDNADIEELFQSLGRVSVKRMFGGKGIYCDGIIMALWLRDTMMLKGDAEAGEKYEAAGSTQWTYTHNKTGKDVKMPYWTLPESAWDDPDEMAFFARVAFEAALRSR
jgi:DNA transformation protein and related proteins